MQARDFCTTKVWELPDGVLNMYKFSLVMHEGHAVLFGGMYIASPQSKGNCSNSIIHVNLKERSYEHIKTQGALLLTASAVGRDAQSCQSTSQHVKACMCLCCPTCDARCVSACSRLEEQGCPTWV